MRLLFITGSYPPMKCGVGSYTQKLAHALASNPHCKVMVLSGRNASGSEAMPGVEVFPRIKGWKWRDLFPTVREVRRLRPEVVHFQYPTQGYDGPAAFWLPAILRRHGFPIVQTWHEPVVRLEGVLLAGAVDRLVIVKKDIERHQWAIVNRVLRGRKITWIPGAGMLPAIDLSTEERSGVRNRYVPGGEWLLVFYGFLAPLKGVETLLEVVARTRSRLVLVSDIRSSNSYHRSLLARVDALQIRDRVQVAGFLPERELASLLGSADAVVFPFREGAAEWNTSVDGAVAQGAFVLTTTKGRSGYDSTNHIFRSQVGAVDEMIAALQQYAGTRVGIKSSDAAWAGIAKAHMDIYQELLDR